MKILVIVPNNNLGGAEQFLRMVTNYYCDNENDITLYFFYKKVNDNAWDALAGKHLKKHLFSNKNEKHGFFKFLRHILSYKKIEYDYIFTSNVFVSGITGLLMKLRLLKTKKFVARESTSIFIRYSGLKLLKYKMFYYLGYKKVNLLICQTELMREQLVKALPYLSAKAKTISNPINLDEMNQMSKKEFSGNLPAQYIVTAGRLMPIKGFDVLIESFARISESFPKMKLLILGEGAQEPELRELSYSLGVDEKVVFEGYVSNVYPYFKNAKLCVVSSILEGFPNVLLQMMSQNSNVVSTLCAGGIDSIKGVKTCKPGDIDALTQASVEVLNSDTKKNRFLFDTFLKQNDIGMFIDKVEKLA